MVPVVDRSPGNCLKRLKKAGWPALPGADEAARSKKDEGRELQGLADADVELGYNVLTFLFIIIYRNRAEKRYMLQ